MLEIKGSIKVVLLVSMYALKGYYMVEVFRIFTEIAWKLSERDRIEMNLYNLYRIFP